MRRVVVNCVISVFCVVSVLEWMGVCSNFATKSSFVSLPPPFSLPVALGSTSLVFFPPQARGVDKATLEGLSTVPDPASMPDEERERTLDPHANDPNRFGVPIGLVGASGFGEWVNGSVGGVACEEVRDVDGWEPSGLGSVGMVCEGLREGKSGEVVGAVVWFKNYGALESVVATQALKYDELLHPIVTENTELASDTNGVPSLSNDVRLGRGVAWIGDLDGDGIASDILVGSYTDDTGGSNRGAVYTFTLNRDGSVKRSVKIASDTNGGPTLANGDYFGVGVAWIGDIDQDGIASDIAVGASYDGPGVVHIISLNRDGTAKRTVKIGDNENGGPDLSGGGEFGSGICFLGDVDGDGFASHIVGGAQTDDTGGSNRGAVFVMQLDESGVSIANTKIASDTNGMASLSNEALFGFSVAWIGDVDGDGVAFDIAVGAHHDSTAGNKRGSVWVLSLAEDLTVERSVQLTSNTNGVPTLHEFDDYGTGVTWIGDINGDGLESDIAVGVGGDDDYGTNVGSIYIHSLDEDGLSILTIIISHEHGGGPSVVDGSTFGLSVSFAGTGPNDGSNSYLIAGVPFGDTGGNNRGGVEVLSLSDTTDKTWTAKVLGAGTPAATLEDLNTTSIPLFTIPTTPTPLLPRVDPRAVDATRRALPIALLTEDFAAKTSITVINATVGGRECESVSLLTQWPKASNTRKVGVACEGIPEGEMGSAADVEVAIESSDGKVMILLGENAVYYDDYDAPRVESGTKIAHETSGGPSLANSDMFGISVAVLGDVNGDGVVDIGIGAAGDDTGGSDRGAVYGLVMSSTGTALATVKIHTATDNAPLLNDGDAFGTSLAWLGKARNVSNTLVVVGAPGDDSGGSDRGAAYVIELDANGAVEFYHTIASEIGGGPSLSDNDNFGSSACSLGDANNDGVAWDMAVGAPNHDSSRGALYVLSLDTSYNVIRSIQITNSVGGGPSLSESDQFAASLSWMRDVDGDGFMSDLAVGAPGDGNNYGAVYILRLDADGESHDTTELKSGANGAPTLSDDDFFGSSIAQAGDVDGDGIDHDLIVAAHGDDIGGDDLGSVYVLSLSAKGNVKKWVLIAPDIRGGPSIASGNQFGTALGSLFDLSGSGFPDTFLGSDTGDDTGGSDRGALQIGYLPDASDVLSSPLFLGTSSLVSSVEELTSSMPLNPYFSTPLSAIPLLDPHGVDTKRQVLPVAIRTQVYNSSAMVNVVNITIGDQTCTSAEILSNWPDSSENSKLMGVACVGPPGGSSDQFVDVSVYYEEVATGMVHGVTGKNAVRYDTCMPTLLVSDPSDSYSITSVSPTTISSLGGTRLEIFGTFGATNLSTAYKTSSSLWGVCGEEWSTRNMQAYAPTASVPSNYSEVYVFWLSVGARPCLQVRWLSSTKAECIAPPGLGEDLDVFAFVSGEMMMLEDAVSYDNVLAAVSSASPSDVDSDTINFEGTSTIRLNNSFISPLPIDGISPTTLSLDPPLFSTTISSSDNIVYEGETGLNNVPTPEGYGLNRSVVVCFEDNHGSSTDLGSSLAFHTTFQTSSVCTPAQGAAEVSYSPPTITTVNPATSLDPLGGDVLTITGEGFGDPSDLSSEGLAPIVYLGTKECLAVSHISSTTVRCTTPTLSGNADVTITIAGATSTDPVTVSVLSVSLVAVSPRQVLPAAEGVRTLDFSVTVFGASEVLRLFIGAVECEDFDVVSDDSIRCNDLPIPPVWETDDSWLYVASANTSVSVRPVLRAESPPSILAVNTPQGVPTDGGIVIEVVGGGFGLEVTDFDAVVIGGSEDTARGVWNGTLEASSTASQTEAVVLRRSDALANLTSSDGSSVDVLLPSGCGTNVPVRVITTWELISPQFAISYDAPTLSTASLTDDAPPALLFPGLDSLSIDLCGSNLAPRTVDIDTISIGGLPCSSFEAISPSCVRCTSLATPGSNASSASAWPSNAIEVVIRGQSSDDVLGLATFVPLPSLSQATPTVGEEGDTVTLLGEGMGEDGGYVTAVLVGGSEDQARAVASGDVSPSTVASANDTAMVTTITHTSNIQISFALPAGVGEDVAVRFITSTNLLSNSKTISFAAPVINSVTPSVFLPGEASIEVLLCGDNFPPRQEDLDLVSFGDIQCDDPVVEVGCVRCMSLSTPNTSFPTSTERIVVGGREATSTLATYVAAPSVSSLSPSTAKPGDTITINGQGFGASADDVKKVWVDGVACESLSWTSPQLISCTIPDPHATWTAAEADDSIIVPYVVVSVELTSGITSTSENDGEKLTPGGDVRLRPDPSDSPTGVVAWRPVGQSGTLTVRWRFPGPTLEAARIGDSGADVIATFRVHADSSTQFDDESNHFSNVPIARDASMTRITADSDDPDNADAWEWHEVRIPALTAQPLHVRVRGENSDGVTSWVYAQDPDPRPGMVHLSDQIVETCQEVQYLATTSATTICQACPVGAVCGGLASENVTAKQGYWRVPWSENGLGFARCDIDTICIGHPGSLVAKSINTTQTSSSNDSVAEQWAAVDEIDRPVALSSITLKPTNHEECATGHRGVMCSGCAPNYFPGVGGVCTACGPRGWVAARFVLLVIAILVLFSILLLRAWMSRLRSSSKEVILLKILFTHFQTVAIVGSVQLNWPVDARNFFNVVDSGSSFSTSGLAIECLSGTIASDPFLRTVIILVMPLFLVAYVAGFWSVMGLVEQMCPSCNRSESGVRDIAAPPETPPTPSTEEGVEESRHASRPTTPKVPRHRSYCTLVQERVFLGLVVLAFLVHTPLTTAAFKLMTCRPVAAEGDDENYHLRLVMDLDVRCDTTENMTLIAAISAPMILFISLGIPVGAAFMLWNIGPKGLQTLKWKERLGFLTNGYREKTYYWECVVLLRKVFLAFTTTTLAPSGAGMQITMALLVVLLAMALHARAQPYNSNVTNMLEGLALVTGATTLVGGQFVMMDANGLVGTASGIVGTAASILIIIVNTILLIVAIALFSSRARQFLTSLIRGRNKKPKKEQPTPESTETPRPYTSDEESFTRANPMPKPITP